MGSFDSKITFSSQITWKTFLFGIVLFVIVGIIAAFITYIVLYNGKHQAYDLEACISKVGAGREGTAAIADAKSVLDYCFARMGDEAQLDLATLHVDNYLFNRFETFLILIMVVAITISGVILSAVQLIASYKLAVQRGSGDLSGGADIIASKDSISFKTAVVGLGILAISFAFFIVYVSQVYTMKPDKPDPGYIAAVPGPDDQTPAPAAPGPPASK